MNECAAQPCNNGGTCRDLDGDYACQCPSPYVGKQCQLRKLTSIVSVASLLLLLVPIPSAVRSPVSQDAPLCWGWRVAQSRSLRFQRPLFAMASSACSAGAPIWRDSITRAWLMPGRQPATTGTPGSRSEKGLASGWSGRWVSVVNGANWLWFRKPQINLQKKMRLTGIITQGASHLGTAEYIKAFKVASSLDGRTYATQKVEGQRRDKVKEAAAPGITGHQSSCLSSSLGGFSLLVFVRSLLVTQTTTAQRPTSLSLPSWPSTFASSRWFAAERARCAWSWWAVS